MAFPAGFPISDISFKSPEDSAAIYKSRGHKPDISFKKSKKPCRVYLLNSFSLEPFEFLMLFLFSDPDFLPGVIR